MPIDLDTLTINHLRNGIAMFDNIYGGRIYNMRPQDQIEYLLLKHELAEIEKIKNKKA